MDRVKRLTEFSEFFSVDVKNLRTTYNNKKSIACIEDLSNEIFYEIFEYLDGCEIYKAFFNLNSRFQHLITYSLLPLKIKLSSNSMSKLEDYIENIIIPNRERILSLYFIGNTCIEKFSRLCIIDSFFSNLESIVFEEVLSDQFIVLLFYLKSLPRLFSLNTHLYTKSDCNLSNIYQTIFSLSSLKYNSLSLAEFRNISILAFPTINEPFSTIEYLTINHYCTLEELFSLIHYTPRLHHLICGGLRESYLNLDSKQSITLSNLTYICIRNCHVHFNEFEMFMTKLLCQLKVLRINQYLGKPYFDAYRWERLILNCMPHLSRFDYDYCGYNYTNNDGIYFGVIINHFTSPFWVERQWIFEFEINDEEINCSIHSHRKKWFNLYEYSENVTHPDENSNQKSIQHSSSVLNIISYPFDEQNQSFIDKFRPIFDTVQFTSLNIKSQEVPVRILIEIIRLLPNLDSLKILSLPVFESKFLNIKADHLQIPVSNKITTVNLGKITDFRQIYFLINLCPHMQHLQIGILKEMNLEIPVRFILMKTKTNIFHLCSLSLCYSNANEQMVDNLRKMIDTDKLLDNYIIKRECNNIFLTWK